MPGGWPNSPNRRYRKVVKRARRATCDPLEWHRVRLDVKKLRYNAEFFVNACAGKTARAFARELRQLQEQFGALNDLAVAPDILAPPRPLCRALSRAFENVGGNLRRARCFGRKAGPMRGRAHENHRCAQR